MGERKVSTPAKVGVRDGDYAASEVIKGHS